MIYDEFRACENATIKITSQGSVTIDPDTREPVYSETTIFSDTGIFYELSASEQVARTQIQKSASSQIILDPTKVTTTITETMKLYITTSDKTDKYYRIVTVNNPLNRNEAIIIDVVQGEQ